MTSRRTVWVARCALMVLMGVAALFVAGCTSWPGYHPAANPGDFGYRNAAISSDRYRVAYAGGYGVARSLVEKFALYRAAMVTLDQGAERFRVVSRQTTPVSTVRSLPAARVGFGVGWGAPYFGAGFGLPVGVTSDTRYESVLMIQVGSEVPEHGPHVYYAQEVKRHLAGLIARSHGQGVGEHG